MMSNMPDITILIVTFNRPNEIRRVIEGLQKHIVYSGKLRWHLADDGSPSGYVAAIREIYPEVEFTLTKTSRKGWGANVNKALRFIKTDYIFLCEDDYLAQRDLDLDSGMLLLMSDLEIGLVRYDGIEEHRTTSKEIETLMGVIPCLVIDHAKSSFYQYSNRPHLRHKRLHEHYGLYAEGLSLVDTENNYAARIKDQLLGPMIVALPDGIECAFLPIAKSWKGTEFDKETVKR